MEAISTEDEVELIQGEAVPVRGSETLVLELLLNLDVPFDQRSHVEENECDVSFILTQIPLVGQYFVGVRVWIFSD